MENPMIIVFNGIEYINNINKKEKLENNRRKKKS